MIKAFLKLFGLIVLIIFPNYFLLAQTEETHLDSIKTFALIDTALESKVADFEDSVFQYFTPQSEIGLDEIESSIKKDWSAVLKQNSWVEIDKFGFLGQVQTASLGGRKKSKFYLDGFSPEVTPLYFPQVGGLDLNSYPLENVQKIRFWSEGIEEILGWSEAQGGFELFTKELKTEEPYSRFWVDRGSWGFKRTQMEFGRKISKSFKAYLIGTFRSSGGDTVFSDSDSRFLLAKTSFNLKKWNAEIWLSENKNKDNNPLYEGKREDKNWISHFKFSKKINQGSSLCFLFNYGKSDQEIKNLLFKQRAWQERWSFKSAYLFGFDRHLLKAEGYFGINNFRTFAPEIIVDGNPTGNLIPSPLHQIKEGYLSLANLFPFFLKSQGLLFFRLEKKEFLPFDVSVSGGVSYQFRSPTKIFFTGGWVKSYPNIAELYLDSLNYEVGSGLFYRTRGNPNLEKGTSIILSLGGNSKFSDFIAGWIFTFQKRDNEIFWLQNGIGKAEGDFFPVNRDLRFYGANFFLKYKKNRFVESDLSYSYKNESEKLYPFLDSSRTSNRQVAFLPFHTLTGYLQVGDEFLKNEMGATLRVEGKLNSKKYLNDYFYDKRTTAEVGILSAKATLRFLDFHIYYVVDNIFNKRVVIDDNYYLAGRNMWLGFYWEFFD